MICNFLPQFLFNVNQMNLGEFTELTIKNLNQIYKKNI
jgi:hypothetical protein